MQGIPCMNPFLLIITTIWFDFTGFDFRVKTRMKIRIVIREKIILPYVTSTAKKSKIFRTSPHIYLHIPIVIWLYAKDKLL